LTNQLLVAYDQQKVVRVTSVSTGKKQTPTPTGFYHIKIKLRYDDMRGSDYYLRNVPYVMYFYQGYALHGTYWHTNFGHPASHGCVNLPTEEAAWLYEWASVGTPVVIHE
jgi:lipoprotein-anchoring transpeptidase ErfK/SrfK